MTGGAHLPLLSAAAPPAAPAAAPLPAAAAPLIAAAAAPLAAAAAARIVRVGGRAAVATLAAVTPLVLASGLMGAALVSTLLVAEVSHERADLRVHALPTFARPRLGKAVFGWWADRCAQLRTDRCEHRPVLHVRAPRSSQTSPALPRHPARSCRKQRG